MSPKKTIFVQSTPESKAYQEELPSNLQKEARTTSTFKESQKKRTRSEDDIIPPTTITPSSTILFSDTFSSPTESCLNGGDTFDAWNVIFAGYGCVSSDGNSLQAYPKTSTSSRETHAALISGPSFSLPFTYELTVETTNQLRQNSAPNPWEVAWVVWAYTDNEHFYYFIPKPNGWELGKEDPAYPGSQRFLATGSDVTFPIGEEYHVQVTHDTSNTMTIAVDGNTLVTFTDTERPYTTGKIALYTEDAAVSFDDVVVQ